MKSFFMIAIVCEIHFGPYQAPAYIPTFQHFRILYTLSLMDYSYLDSDERIAEAVAAFSLKPRIAVDFEGEFNLHIYGEHLCLIQVYDGTSFYLIDPRSERVTEKGLSAFFSSPVKKVWFDCQSDASLVYKVYGMTISNILDIRVLAKALGYQGNLKGLEEMYLGIDSGLSKKKNQQANWLRRPIPDEQIRYALEDVAHLMELEDVLTPLVHERKLDKQVSAAMKSAVSVSRPSPPWTRLGGWKRLGKKEKVYARHIFIARDAIARRFNVPAARVMDKRMILSLSEDVPRSEEALRARLDGQPERFIKLLVPALWSAIVKAGEEISG